MSESKKSAQNTPTKEASKNGSADKEKEKALVDLGFLEEDDDFEEFPTENWKDQMENEEEQGPVNIWEDDWDDDNIEDDFSKQLKAELEKRTMNSTSASVRANNNG